MEFFQEKRAALRMLTAIEDATLSIADTRDLLEEADPALVHLVFGWLRTRYHGGHSASDGVLGRIAEICRESPAVARRAAKGAQDPIATWFEEAYDYRELDRDAFISVVVDKLEG